MSKLPGCCQTMESVKAITQSFGTYHQQTIQGNGSFTPFSQINGYQLSIFGEPISSVTYNFRF
ncbi:hypothetical protein IC229_04555 [Spirosoma sp. BT702]|uniref:Uncharacterized protein n=1 Tax=Spirosoma profusum TaxID=2771354 RepID=A0A926XTC1_9BACT|nr:hypothetical protein [Spirosoma profusum]MBD2699893.1 hypothetical protein [Spirosoma profusum]